MAELPFPSLVSKPTPDCPSDLTLDRLAGGEDIADAEAHVGACSACAERLAQRRQARVAFAEAHDVPSLAARALRDARPRRRLWRWAVAPGLATATAVLLLLLRRDGMDGDFATKGGAALRVIALARSGQQREVVAGDAIHPGERLRFVVDAEPPAWVAVLGRDDRGGLWRGSPTDATLHLESKGTLLPGAVELDGQGKTEELFLFVCGTRRPLAILESALRDGRGLDGCLIKTMKLDKTP